MNIGGVEVTYTLSDLLLVVSLLVLCVNLFISFRMRRDVKKNLRLAERRERFLREEKERLDFLHEERRMLVEELMKCCDEAGGDEEGGNGGSLPEPQKERVLEGLHKLEQSLARERY